ncbi:MAG TPA: sulfotransferase domain-containing protein [Anaerolineales bacterium]|nr:sulfotransferase domain-containing protein [Anaerolineales bacterium]
MAVQESFKRPTTIQEMHDRMKHFATEEGWQKGLAYKPGPTDVFIVTPPKCGTTWMQQIVHGLRTRGAMDFDEITRVVPWLEMAYDCGIDIYAPQVGDPRAFKSHSTFDQLPKGGKYIIVVRDPKDALVSAYHFMEGMFFEKGSISLETFAREDFFLGRAIHKHILAFWDRRDDENVLPLCYENMKEDLVGTIERVADFIGISLDEELKHIALKQSDIKFMQQHKHQFEDHIIRKARSAAMQLPIDGQLNKVRNGQVGESKQVVPDELGNELDDIWQEEIAAKIGLNSYEDLRKELVH